MFILDGNKMLVSSANNTATTFSGRNLKHLDNTYVNSTGDNEEPCIMPTRVLHFQLIGSRLITRSISLKDDYKRMPDISITNDFHLINLLHSASNFSGFF
eukprot:NODE_552_length_6155_cov_0.827774.p9 type:complete len:100 gc:universal NODE_552_length_6155_cov_0.827774:2241-2540(+)